MSLKSIFVLSLVFAGVLAQADKWCFVVAGDGRSKPGDPVRPEDRNGMNTKITAEIRDAILRERAKTLLWTGDLVLGSKDPAEFRTQIKTWMEIMKPLWDHGVEVLPVRGNHENTCPDSKAIWDEFFTGRYALPQNGPWNAKNLTYYSLHGTTIFIGLDNYTNGPGTVPLNWLEGLLGKKRFDHVFTYCHEMAFMAGLHTDNLDRNPADRDTFVKLLSNAGSRAFFAGHDHLYDHMSIQGNGAPQSLQQYVAGTAGAPFYKDAGYKGNNGSWNLTRIKHLDDTYGYLLVEIDGKNCTITFKGRNDAGKYVPMDVWKYKA